LHCFKIKMSPLNEQPCATPAQIRKRLHISSKKEANPRKDLLLYIY
jgi:hypothetical protein